MSAPVVVTSTSKLLRISLLNDRCSMTFSDDCSALFVDPPDNTFVSTIDLCIKEKDGNEISAVSFPMGCASGQRRIRTDGLFSLVFDAGESLEVVSEWVFDHYSTESLLDKKGRFEMAVNIHLLDAVPDSFVSRTTPLPIYSGTLKVGESTVPVSKELLAVTSHLFTTHFYGSDPVVLEDIFEKKELDKDVFPSFINSILHRKWTFPSVEQSLVTLKYASRLEMPYLHKRVLPSLLKNASSLPQDVIKDTLLLCDRFKENEQLIELLLRQCKDVQTLLFECAHKMQQCSIVAAIKVLKELHTPAENRASDWKTKRALELKRDAFLIEYDNLPNTAPVCLRFFDENGMVEKEDYFKVDVNIVEVDFKKFKDFKYSILRDKIPKKYTVIKTEGYTANLEGEEDHVRVSPSQVVDVHCYRS